MLKSINEIIFSMNQKWLIRQYSKNEEFKAGHIMASALNLELANTGFLMSERLFDAFSKMPIESFHRASEKLITICQERLGYKIGLSYTLIENFPFVKMTVVSNLNNYISISSKNKKRNKNIIIDELLIENGFTDILNLEVLTNGDIVVITNTKERIKLNTFDKVFKTIDLATHLDIENVRQSIIYSKTPLPEYKLNYIEILLKQKQTIDISNIKQREVFSRVMKIKSETLFKKNKQKEFIELFNNNKKSPKDILRLAADFSNSDISLKNEVFFELKNWQKYAISSLIDCIEKDELSDMKQNHNLWLKLFQTIHIGSKRYSKFSNAQKIAELMRSSKQYAINKTEDAIQNIVSGNFFKGISSLSQTPGYFLRNLDLCIRQISSEDLNMSIKPSKFSAIIAALKIVVKKADISLLMQVATFLSKVKPTNKRAFFPGGGFSKMILENDTRVVDEDAYNDTKQTIVNMIWMSLYIKMKEKENPFSENKKIFIDEQLKTVIAPFSMKSMADGFNQISTGSIINGNPENNIFRLFVWWRETQSSQRVDVDLSVIVLDEEFKRCAELAYYNITQNVNIAEAPMAHSGDITSAPIYENGSSEFIDVNCEKMIKDFPTARYVGASINVFTRQKFNKFECEAGFMERSNAGELFEPTTVKNKFILNNNVQNTLPFLFDVIEKKILWINVALPGIYQTIHKSENTRKASQQDVFKEILSFKDKKMNCYDIIELYATVFNIEIVDNKNDADQILELNDEFFTTFSKKWL